MDYSALTLTPKDGAVRFEVHAKPKAKKSALGGVREGALEVAIAAPPVEGAANVELCRFLAKVLGVSKSRVEVVRGESSRVKLLSVEGVTVDEVRARLAASG